LPLHSRAAGTELRHFGVVYGRLRAPGRARVVKREAADLYVVAAVDSDITIQGWVPAGALGPALTSDGK